MRIKVIYIDGTSDMVRPSTLGRLMELDGIVAYQCSEGWVEVRRKQLKGNYFGPERRKSKPETSNRV